MIIPAKNFSNDTCQFEIVAYSYDEYPKTTVYSDNISDAMDMAEAFYVVTEGIVEVSEMVNERWQLSYVIEPFWGYKQPVESDEEIMDRWMNGEICLYA